MLTPASGDEGGRLLRGEGVLALAGQPLVEVNEGVVQQGLGGGGGGVEVGGGELQEGQRALVRLGSGGGLGGPAGGDALRHHGLPID